jgi:urease subunit alpha
MGDPNASIPTPQPVHYRPMFGSLRRRGGRPPLTFVSQAALDAGIGERSACSKRWSAVQRLPHGEARPTWCTTTTLPVMEIDAQTYAVRADGQLLTCEPATVLPMAQRYFLF